MENGKVFSFFNISVLWLIWTVQRIFVKKAEKCAATFLFEILSILVRIFYLAVSNGPRITVLLSRLVYKFC